MPAHLNHFAISAALGSTLGSRIDIPAGQLVAHQASSQISNLQHRRKSAWSEDRLAAHRLLDRYMREVRAAFLNTRDGWSPDRVIADPILNSLFLESCRKDFGIEESDFRINLALLQLRKSGHLPALKSRRGDPPREQWRYMFAAEFAARVIFFENGLSVDSMICHTKVRAHFDRVASALSPGWSVFDYRWAALNARKKGSTVWRASPGIGQFSWSDQVPFQSYAQVPDDEGVLVLEEDSTPLLVMSSEDMRESAEVGQRIAEARIVLPGLWTPDRDHMAWRFAGLPSSTSDARFGLVHRFVADLKPIFNIPRGSIAA